MNASRGPGRGRRELRVRVGGRLACVPEDYAAAPPAFALLVEALRYRG